MSSPSDKNDEDALPLAKFDTAPASHEDSGLLTIGNLAQSLPRARSQASDPQNESHREEPAPPTPVRVATQLQFGSEFKARQLAKQRAKKAALIAAAGVALVYGIHLGIDALTERKEAPMDAMAQFQMQAIENLYLPVAMERVIRKHVIQPLPKTAASQARLEHQLTPAMRKRLTKMRKNGVTSAPLVNDARPIPAATLKAEPKAHDELEDLLKETGF